MKHIHAQSLIVHRATDPTTSDNASRGFAVESEWYNGTIFWKLTSFSGSDAIWEQVGGGGSGTSLTDTITAGENLVENDLVYLKSDGKYWKADYLTTATCSTELRLVTDATITANASGESLTLGLKDSFTGLTAGSVYYVGASGAICLYSAIPDTEGIIVRSVGTAKSSTELEFNPDETYIETTLVPLTPPVNNSIIIEKVATEDILAFNLINVDGSKPDSSIIGKRNWVLGITEAVILNGFSGNVVTSGEITNPAWSFTSGNQIYLNGISLSVTPPTSGFLQPIGTALSATKINVNIKEAILI